MPLAPFTLEPIKSSSRTAVLADPAPSLLADYLASRMAMENGELPSFAAMGEGDFGPRPILPRISNGALKLYMQHKAVDSYPLIFTTLALAHPN